MFSVTVCNKHDCNIKHIEVIKKFRSTDIFIHIFFQSIYKVLTNIDILVHKTHTAVFTALFKIIYTITNTQVPLNET